MGKFDFYSVVVFIGTMCVSMCSRVFSRTIFLKVRALFFLDSYLYIYYISTN